MSGMGHKPVPIPENVTITQAAGRLDVTGAKGSLQVPLDAAVTVDVGADGVTITRPDDTRRSKAVQGLVRALVANAVQGVSAGFAKVLEINGIGYRAEGAGNVVRLNLGFSHPIFYQLPDGVTAKVERQTQITIEGIDKQLVGEVAASIRRLRPPEPYKGKGVRYAGEQVRRKAGKTAAGAGAG